MRLRAFCQRSIDTHNPPFQKSRVARRIQHFSKTKDIHFEKTEDGKIKNNTSYIIRVPKNPLPSLQSKQKAEFNSKSWRVQIFNQKQTN